MADENRIWSALLGLTGGNAFGAAGLIGNLYAESALNPRNLQQSFEKKLGMTDDSYTAAVDNGIYENFVHDGAGYGLAQWTYWSRKDALLGYAMASGRSVGDLELQLTFLSKELRTNYAGVLKALRTAKSVRAASDAVLTGYERPKDQSEKAKVKRAAFGKQYYDTYATNTKKESDTMAVKIGSARIDENGNAHGGKAGDQTGKEVSTQNWYNHKKGWRVFRAKDPAAAEKIAWDMQAACDNPKIGYDQYERGTLYTVAKLVGFNCAKVAAACETDCSALVRVCCAYAGVMLPDIRTTNEPKALLDSGAFVELTGAKYTDSPDYLKRGDILCTRTQGHTVVVLSNGSKAEVAPVVAQGLSRGDHGTAVTAMQRALLAWDAKCLPKYGADGDFGGETEKAVMAFQQAEALPVTGVYDEATRKALTTTGDKPAGSADDGGTDDSELSDVPVPPMEQTGRFVVILPIHVRSAPGDQYMSLGTAQTGYRLPYQGETHQDANGVPWYLVEYDGQNGWVSSAVSEVVV